MIDAVVFPVQDLEYFLEFIKIFGGNEDGKQ